ncbi:MAG: 6-carboxytetrahydropterin synthase [Acidobacteriota bacterium]|jgi:6-pyruvoyltetrahydropterin/6-carboxytetrahydropterin synthase
MHRIVKIIDFCYGHRLLEHPGKCLHLHGHNGRVEVTVAAERLDPRGMVADFADLKGDVKGWIDENLDHKMLLHRGDPLVHLLKEAGEPVFVMDSHPTAEAIARLIFDTARAMGWNVSEVKLFETPSSVAVHTDPDGGRAAG